MAQLKIELKTTTKLEMSEVKINIDLYFFTGNAIFLILSKNCVLTNRREREREREREGERLQSETNFFWQ